MSVTTSINFTSINFTDPPYTLNSGSTVASSKKVNMDVSFIINTGDNQITHQATILDGTFSLKDRVTTLTTYQQELERACSTKERVKRTAITLLVIALIAGGIAAMIFGGPIGLAAGAPGLGIFMMASDLILADLVLGHMIKYNVFFPITMPIFLAYYMLTYESKRAKKVENCESENVTIARYVVSKKEEINTWLEARRKEINHEITQEKEKLNQHLETAHLRALTDTITGLDGNLSKVNSFISNLQESYGIAQEIIAAAEATD